MTSSMVETSARMNPRLEIGVDLSRCLRCGRPGPHGPRPRLLGTDGVEREQPEALVGGPDHHRQRALPQTEAFEQFGSFVGGQLRPFLLQPGRDRDYRITIGNQPSAAARPGRTASSAPSSRFTTHTAGFRVRGLVSRKAASASSDHVRVRSDAPPASTSTASLIASAAPRFDASELASLLSRSARRTSTSWSASASSRKQFLGLGHRIGRPCPRS